MEQPLKHHRTILFHALSNQELPTLDTFELHKIWLLAQFKNIQNKSNWRVIQVSPTIQYMSCFFQEPSQASAPPASLVPLLDICRSSHAWMDFGAWPVGKRSCAPSKPSPLNMVLDKGSWMVGKPELKCLHSEYSSGMPVSEGRAMEFCSYELWWFQLSWFIM